MLDWPSWSQASFLLCNVHDGNLEFDEAGTEMLPRLSKQHLALRKYLISERRQIICNPSRTGLQKKQLAKRQADRSRWLADGWQCWPGSSVRNFVASTEFVVFARLSPTLTELHYSRAVVDSYRGKRLPRVMRVREVLEW